MTAATIVPLPATAAGEVDRVHAEALAGLATITERVRYACEHGPGPRTDAVRQWLAAYGIETRRPYVSTLVTGYRRGRGIDDTGEIPVITDDTPPPPADDAEDALMVVATGATSPEPDEPRDDTPPASVVTDTPEPGPDSVFPAVPADPETAPVVTPPPLAASVVTPEPPSARAPRAGAVMALALSASTTTAAAVLAARVPLTSVLALPWPILAAALFVLVVLAWSAASVVGRLVAGRTARDVALDVASWTVAGVAGFLAAYGQIRFAEWAGVTGSMRFLVPGILEPSVVVLLLLANRRVKRRRAGLAAKPVGKLLALAAILGGFAVYTNVVHAGGKAGLVFGAATVVGLILWWVKLQDDAAPDDWDDAPTSKRLSRRTSRYRLLRWVILPAQTRRAWLISLDHSIADAEIGLDLARRWRRAYDESREAKASRRLARRHASRQIDAYLLNPQ